MSDHIPQEGHPVSVEDVEMILEAVGARQKNFPGEPPAMSFVVVMLNIGDRFAKVTCIEEEWGGLKSDIPKPKDPNDIPRCPNGHPLYQDSGLRLGWIKETS